jgi:hypothetical protein
MNSKTNPSFNPDTITTSTTPEMPFFVGNPSFGAHHWTHKKRLILFALLYVAVSLYIDLARWWSSKPLTNDTRLLFFCSYFLGMTLSVIGQALFPPSMGLFAYPGASPPWFSGLLSFLVTHWILILVPLSPLHHNLAFSASGTIVSLIATGFLIKVYPI